MLDLKQYEGKVVYAYSGQLSLGAVLVVNNIIDGDMIHGSLLWDDGDFSARQGQAFGFKEDEGDTVRLATDEETQRLKEAINDYTAEKVKLNEKLRKA